MAERGAAGTSMRQLASACGVQVAAIYHYFDSKEALLSAVIAERNYGSRLNDPLEIDPGAPARDRLAAVFHAIWTGAIEEESVWRLLLGEGIRSEPAAMPVGQELLGAVRPGVAAYLKEWVPELADHEVAADVLLGQLFLGFIRHMFDPALDPATIAADAEATLTAALLR